MKLNRRRGRTEPRRCPLCLRWEHGSSACFPADSNTYTPPEWHQGENYVQIEGDVDPSVTATTVSTRLVCPHPEDERMEFDGVVICAMCSARIGGSGSGPVCARCGQVEGIAEHDRSHIQPCMVANCTYHAFEAALWWVDVWCNKHNGHHLQNGDNGTRIVVSDYESGQMVCQLLNAQARSGGGVR